MAERFNLPIGLSDHSAGSIGAIVGVTLGACVIEKHVMMEGVDSPDSKFSMKIEEFARMVNDIKNAKIIAKGPCYDLTDGERESVNFRRSIFAVHDIKEGETLTDENIGVIRPGYGMKPKMYKLVKGKNANRAIKRGEPISEGMVNI
jgi:sialic acid synthase SpsE